MQYRTELDALNKIVKQNDEIIELLKQLTEPKTTAEPIEHKPKRQYTRRKENGVVV